MANEGYIFVKKAESEHKRPQTTGRWSTKQFFTPVDKGSAKPAFCYPNRAERLQEEYLSMKRNLDEGNVDPERKLAYKLKTEKIGERLDLINSSFETAREIINKAPDSWIKRRETLAEEIAARTPTRDDVVKRRVNPHSNLKNEKQGTKDKRPLEQVKREYTIISRALQARGEDVDANTSFLQKDK